MAYQDTGCINPRQIDSPAPFFPDNHHVAVRRLTLFYDKSMEATNENRTSRSIIC
jgi:hypothetical protein